MDARNAFGSPSHNVILETIFNLWDNVSFSWFQQFLSDRTFYVQINDKRSSIRKLPDRGLPQGSGCGPLLWNTVFNPILENIEKTLSNNLCIAYADDLALSLHGDNEEDMLNNVQHTMEVIDAQLDTIDVQRAPNKTIGFCVGKWSAENVKLDRKSVV